MLEGVTLGHGGRTSLLPFVVVGVEAHWKEGLLLAKPFESLAFCDTQSLIVLLEDVDGF